MAALTGKCGLASSLNGESSEQPLEKESLQSADLEKGISFFKDQCVIRVANRLELRQKAYEYIHKTYLSEGLIKKENCGLRLSIFDALLETTTFVIEDHKGQISGALTLVFDSPIGLPSDAQYKDEIDSLRRSGRKISELVSFGIDKAYRGSVKALAGLFYCAYLLAWRIRAATDFIINVIPQHSNFYCRTLLFRQIGEEKKCPRADETYAVLLNLPLALPTKLKAEKRIFPLNLFRYSDQEEIEISKKLQQMLVPMSDEEFYVFFIEKTDIWEKASPLHKEYLKNICPPDKVDHFSVSRALARGVAKRYCSQDLFKHDLSKSSSFKN